MAGKLVMGAELVTGNEAAIVAMIAGFTGPVRVETVEAGKPGRGGYPDTFGRDMATVTFGDDSEVRAFYAAAFEGIDKLPAWAQRDARQNALINAQRSSGRVGQAPYDLSTNIYGWAAGSQLLSNLTGSRYAVTGRGATLEEVFRTMLGMCARKGTTFTLKFGTSAPTVRIVGFSSEEKLPAAVRAALLARATRALAEVAGV